MKKTKIKSLTRLVGFCFKKHKLGFTLVLFGIILSSFSLSSGPMLISYLTDNIIDIALRDGFAVVQNRFNIFMLVAAAIFLAGILATILYSYIAARITQDILHELRQKVFNHMEELPISYFDKTPHGDIMSTYTNDIEACRQFIANTFPNLVSLSVSLLYLLFQMIFYSLYLMLIVFVGVGVLFLVMMVIGKKTTTHFTMNQKSIGKMEGYIQEMIHGQKVVKVFTHEEEAKRNFDKLNEELAYQATKANHYGNIMMPIMGNIGNIFYVILAAVGSIFAITKIDNVSISQGVASISVGVVVAFLILVRQFFNFTGQMASQISMIALAKAGSTRVFELLDLPIEQDDGYVTLVNVEENKGELIETAKRTHRWAWKHPHHDGTITYTELMGDIVFDHVDFGYTEDKMVLNDIYIYAHPGQKIALVGATGAGKTTITNLLNRFYDIQDGKIRYDGINITKIKKGDLRRSLAIVLQDTNLFHGTIMDNIRYAREDSDEEEVYRAAKIANAYDFIMRLPNGFNTKLSGDGANLSQGQRQLISIARAACADAPVMILDEATSSIDTRTEALVQEGTNRLMEGRTVFVIAHRLSTVRNSDAIMVMDKGEIIERGNHESLISNKGLYYRLYTGAFELE